MNFEHEKRQCLDKKDKSQKQSIDKRLVDLIDKINAKKDYYTTSSCSGRIILIEKPSRKKQECEWLFSTHDYADIEDLQEGIGKIGEHPVWFQQEPFIIHICCREMESAESLLGVIRLLGFKHSGIISMKNRIIIEIIGTDMIQTPIAIGGELIVDKDYLKILVDEANLKQKQNHKNIKKLEQNI